MGAELAYGSDGGVGSKIISVTTEVVTLISTTNTTTISTDHF